MTNKLLIVVLEHIPSTLLIAKVCKYLEYAYEEIKIVELAELNYQDLLSGKYKLLFLRISNTHLMPLIKLISQFKLKYAYYIDDNLWEIDHNIPIGKHCQEPQFRWVMNEFVKHAHFIIASTPHLADYIVNNNLNQKTFCLNSGFDFALVEDLKQKNKDKIIKIVYAATLHRDNDFACCMQALEKILNEYGDKVVVYFSGYVPNALKGKPNVVCDEQFYYYDDHIKQHYEMGFDIGLAPLNDTIFNRSKSNVKYREYAACHIAGIYSNMLAYTDSITNGVNGLLVSQTVEEWYIAIKLLIDNPALKHRIAENAYIDVKNNYASNVVAKSWASVLNELPYNTKVPKFNALVAFIFKKYLALAYLIFKIKKYYQRNGFWKGIARLASKCLKIREMKANH